MIVGYIRVSTSKQDLNNQLYAVDNYCQNRGLKLDEIVESNAISSRKSTSDRKIDKLLQLPSGSLVIVSQLDRLGRSIGELVQTIDKFKLNGIELHIIDRNLILKPDSRDLSSTIMTTTFALLAEIERSLISERTKAGLARVKLVKKLGRPRTYNFKKDIVFYSVKTLGQRATARQLGCSLSTLQNYLHSEKFG